MTDVADDYTTWDAPYVLGSLTRIERREYEEHLAGCPVCRAAVADLAGLPGLLAMVEPETALAMIEPSETPAAEVDPPAQLLPRLADAAEKRRRRGRWVSVGAAVAAAAAAVAIAVPVVASVTASDNPSTEQVVAERSMQPIKPNPVTASFKVVRADGKTRLVMTCSYGPSDQKYNWNLDLYVIGTDGSQSKLDQWPAGPGTELTIDRTIDKAPEQIQTVQIRLASTGETLLSGTV
ncbi:zf-HC2 domain-containing protein [Nocardia sp. NBC_00565]|uniref:anti-sigma factor family protein n=1 Tax=Nocardia sp. NBC_00565 TaxID=2975993 RepID=UPI002E818D75|nr:zf-HC2 domain-containing protein [Nocardia sp. NBC_00565]WUC02307.1 zf-HC2 domain-containing protein [Nocardia sp. NBC_00565]